MPSELKTATKLLQEAAEIGSRTMPAVPPLTIPTCLDDPIVAPTDPSSCKQHVRINIFFDGTGNNLDADSPDMGHSNVARLFRAHPVSDEQESLYAIYVPGIGTYFRDVNDPGGTTFGMAFAEKGLARLEWAFRQMRDRLNDCDRRALNSPNAKVVDIKLSVFGFSRGAALARAFCRDLAKQCPGEKHQLQYSGRVPIEISFLGLFDTVAAVGIPPAGNTLLDKALDFLVDLSPAERARRMMQSSFSQDPLARQAFGKSAAQPAMGPNSGHYDWGRDMRIGPMVKHGVHLVASHEFRNSFALDSALQGERYPATVKEWALPGAHSDVGGGYEPSEGGKCCARGSLVSMVSLWLMYNEAGKYVPFYAPRQFAEHNRQDFAVDEKSKAGHESMLKAYRAYLAQLPAAEGLGKQMLAHTRLYYAWRFRAIASSPKFAPERERIAREKMEASRNRLKQLEAAKIFHNKNGYPWSADAEANLNTARLQLSRDEMDWRATQRESEAALHDGESIRHAEEGFKGQRAALSAVVQQKFEAFRQAQSKVDQLLMEKNNFILAGAKWPAKLEAELQSAKADLPPAEDAWLRAKARLDTKADDSELLKHIHQYNAQLVDDAIKLDAWSDEDKGRQLRPHYQAILDAYRNEFKLGRGLRDPGVIDFFGNYIHDSLAAFHHDDTRTSDPRIVYMGGDVRMDYAFNEPSPQAEHALG